jgi:quercetin dioxygenase-like cupin family protein
MTTPVATPASDSTGQRWFLGTLLRIVADSSDTAGQLSIMHQRARRGFSPPRHVHHREDTAMYVISGSLTVERGDDLVDLPAGGFVWLPRDVPHSFSVDSAEAEFLEFVTPAGFEQFHVDISDPAPYNEIPEPTEPDIGRILAAIGRYGADVVGPPMEAAARS